MSRDHPFHTDLAALLPSLRAFARSLARDPVLADDLTQEALLKAWAARESFTEGTNLRAWLFTILRNAYFSHLRKHRREIEDADDNLSARLASAPVQDHRMAFLDFAEALAQLPAEQREVLVLIGAAGVSYEEAASICGCAMGTIKSRVNRARGNLAALLGITDSAALTADDRMEAALAGSLSPYAA
jgi:RNA polymerase sigma-70 factor (ECF subfamily)